MTDIFLRERVQNLSGLTKYDQYVDGVPVDLLSTDAWTNVFSISDSPYFVITALRLALDSDGGDLFSPKFRILAAPTGTALSDDHKIFPHGESDEVLDNVILHLKLGIKIPKGHNVVVQMKGSFTTGTPKGILDFISVIFNPPVNH